jgi:hypothetical protein
MATKIVDIKFDAGESVKVAIELQTVLKDLRDRQNELKASGQQLSGEFVQNQASIKELSTQYRIVEKSIIDFNSKQATTKDVTESVRMVMAKEATTINELNNQNTQLNKIKKNLNIENAEEKKLIDEINKKMDANTEVIKTNSSAVERQKMNVGNYSASIKDAFQSLNPLNGGLAGFTERSQQAGGAGNLFKNAMGGMISGVWGLVKASLAFIATPIGAIIAAITVVVTVLYNVFKSFQPVVDKVEQLFAALTATLSVIKNTIIAVATGAKSLGSAFKNLGGDMKDAAKAAMELKKAQQDLDDAMESQKITSSKNRAEADKLMAQSKDLSKTEEQRIALLQKAEKLMEADFNDRKKNADEQKRIDANNLKNKAQLTDEEMKIAETNWAKFKDIAERKSTSIEKDLEKYAESMIVRNEIEGESSQFLEKNIAKQNTLLENKQANEESARQKAMQQNEVYRQSLIKNATDEVALFEAKESSKEKTLLETLEYEKSLSDLRLKALDVEYKNGGKTIKEYEAEKINILNQFNSATLAATTENITKELEIWKLQNSDLLASKGELSQATIDIEKATQKTLYDKRKEIIDATIQDEQDKQIALLQLENDYKNALTSIDDEWKSIQATKKQSERDKSASDYEIKLQELQLQTESELVIEQTIYDRKKLLLIQALEDKKITQEQYDAQSLVDKKSFENKIVEIEKQSRMQSMEVSQNAFKTFGELASAFGVKSKGLNIALTTIDTYFAAQKAYMSQFLPVPDPSSPIRGAIAAAGAVASGIARVKQIASTKFARGGLLRGNSHSNGGIPTPYGELEGGEGVINKRSMADPYLKSLASAINVAGGGVAFAQGGILNTASASSVSNSIDLTNQFREIQVINVVDETASVMNKALKIKNFANV